MAFGWNGRTIYEPGERINSSKIEEHCQEIMDTAKKLKKASEDIRAIADRLNNDKVLYVNHQAYSKNLYDYSDELMKKYSTLYNTVCPTIKSWAKDRYNKEESDYASYLAWKAELEAQNKTVRASGGNGVYVQ